MLAPFVRLKGKFVKTNILWKKLCSHSKPHAILQKEPFANHGTLYPQLEDYDQ